MHHRRTPSFQAKRPSNCRFSIASLSLMSFLAAASLTYLYSSFPSSAFTNQMILLTPRDNPLTPTNGLIIVMPFTKNDFSRIEENLRLWNDYPPCDPLEGGNYTKRIQEESSPTRFGRPEPLNSDGKRESSKKINTAFYFYYNGVMNDEISERISTWRKSASFMDSCFDEIGHISAFLTGDEDNYDPRRIRGNWVRGPNNQFYALLLHNGSNENEEREMAGDVDLLETQGIPRAQATGTLHRPMLQRRENQDKSETQTDSKSPPLPAFRPIQFVPLKSHTSHKNLPPLQSMSTRFQYLFLMEPDSRPIRSKWRDTLLSESGLYPQYLADDVQNGAGNFWMKGSAYRGKCVFEKTIPVTMEEEASGNCKLLGQKIFGHINGNALYNIQDPNFTRFLTQVQNSEFGDWPYDLAIYLYLTSPIRESENRNRLHLYQHSSFIQNHGRYPFDIGTVSKEKTSFVHSDEKLQRWGELSTDSHREAGGSVINGDDDALNPFADPQPPSSNKTILETTPEFMRLLSVVENNMDERRNLAVTFITARSMEQAVNRILLANWIRAWMHLANADSWNPLTLKKSIVAGEAIQSSEGPLPNVMLFAFTEADQEAAVKVITEASPTSRKDVATQLVYRISQNFDLQIAPNRRRINNNLVREMGIMALLMRMNVNVLRSDISAVWLRNPFTYFSTTSFYDLELSRISSTSSSFPSAASSVHWVIGRFAPRISESPSLSVAFSRPSRRTVSFYESLSALHADRPTETLEALVDRHLKTNVYGVKYRILESSLFPESHDQFEKRIPLRTGIAIPYVIDPRRWIHDVVTVPDGTTKVNSRLLQTWRYILEENDAWFVDDKEFQRAELEESNFLTTREATHEDNVIDPPIFLAYYERPMDNGLNNAREALRCALAMALVLNRTLLLPEFHAHHRLNTPVGLEYYFDPQVFFQTWQGVVNFRSHVYLKKLRSQTLKVEIDPVFYIDIGYKDLDPRLLNGGDDDRGAIEGGGWPWMTPSNIPSLSSKSTLDRPLVQFKPSRHRSATAREIRDWFANYTNVPVIELSRSFRRFSKFSKSDDALLNRKVAGSFEEQFEQSLVPSKMIRKAADIMIAAMNDISTGASKAGRVARGLQTETGYACLHLRRGDFLKVHESREREAADPQSAAAKAADVFARLTSTDPSSTTTTTATRLNLTLYLSSDESSSTELLSAFRSRFANVITSQDLIYRIQSPKGKIDTKNKSEVLETLQFLKAISTADEIYGLDQRLGLVEQEVCRRSQLFVGNAYSTFSTRICKLLNSRNNKDCHDIHGRKWPA